MESGIMKLFSRNQETTLSSDDETFWPKERLDEIDDVEFARAIAAGRLAEQAEQARELVDA
jgi:hypothetical protein